MLSGDVVHLKRQKKSLQNSELRPWKNSSVKGLMSLVI